MRVSKIMESGVFYNPWPIIINEHAMDGKLMHESALCRKKCGDDLDRHCSDKMHPAGENLCKHGMSFFRVNLNEDTLTIYGVRGENNPNSFKPNHLKDVLKGRSVTHTEVKEWVSKVLALIELIEKDFILRQSEMLDPLHDPMRLAKQIETKATHLVSGHRDDVLTDELIEKANPDVKSLVKAAGLLNQSFGLLKIYFNPESASFGRKKYTQLHGILRKYASILDDPDNEVKIYLSGDSYRQILVHESFTLVPFAIISNAVKYCLEGNVNIRITEKLKSIDVSVESIGPLIEPSELSTIFDKRVRGKWATETGKIGTGVGLYLARTVAQANGFEIHVSSTNINRYQNKIPLARNRFSFEIPLNA